MTVFPTPGGPVKTICRLVAATDRFCSRRRRSTSRLASNLLISDLTGAEPHHGIDIIERVIRCPRDQLGFAGRSIGRKPAAVGIAAADRYQSERDRIGTDPRCRITDACRG